jgi:prophage antirepressor-like protein
MTIINESGLYALILSSKLPQAKAFKRWVTAEVLPQIRKTWIPQPLVH